MNTITIKKEKYDIEQHFILLQECSIYFFVSFGAIGNIALGFEKFILSIKKFQDLV